jgi:hypothetical protein
VALHDRLRILRQQGIRYASAALIVTIFSAGYLGLSVPVRYVIVVLLALACQMILSNRERGKRKGWGTAILAGSIIAIYFFVVVHPLDANFGDTLFRYVVVDPLAFYVGWLLWKTGNWNSFAKVYVVVSVICAVLAIVEYTKGSALFPRNTELDTISRNSAYRAAVLTEHPLVLAALLLVAIPLAWDLLRRKRLMRLLTIALLVVGIVSTGSRGVLYCFAGWVALLLALRLRKSEVPRWTSVLACIACLVGIGWLLFFPPVFGFIGSADADQASAEYRLQLYSALNLSLDTQPLGWGIGPSAPRGQYILTTQFGDLDVADTLDSEVVSLGLEFGFVGLGAFVLFVVILFSGRRLITSVGQSAVLLTVCGLFLALHAWIGLGSVWLLLLGSACSCTRGDGAPTSGAFGVVDYKV